jgi:hypothetical protein
MELTERKAVEISLELWRWLADTAGTLSKNSWSGWRKYGEMYNSCPLCEYAQQHSPLMYCAVYCPLRGKWGNWQGICECEHNKTSPWVLWLHADHDDKPRHARAMVTLLEQRLSELTKPPIPKKNLPEITLTKERDGSYRIRMGTSAIAVISFREAQNQVAISLSWLERAGFTGEVVVNTNEFSDDGLIFRREKETEK